MKLSISTSQEAIKDSGGSSFIGTEGIYDVTLNFVSVSTTSGGAKQADFNVNYKGNNQVIYGPIIINKDGKTNEIGMSLINKLGVIVGLGEGAQLDVQTETHKVGKDEKAQEFEVITDFSGQDVQLRVQREYSKNPKTGDLNRSIKIRNVFRSDGATAAEIANEGEIGKQRAIELEKYCSAPAYRDDITPEEATAWEAKQAASRKSAGGSPVSNVTEKKTTMFNRNKA